jgi:murein DD-endopeptidase MepM/ murein hydrolase activator NlpD
MRASVLLLAAAAVVALFALFAEPFGPTVALDTPPTTVGRATPLRVVARDRGSGLARVTVSIVGSAGTITIADETYPRSGWLGSGVHEALLAPTLDASAAGVPEGPAEIQVTASDHSWLSALRRGSRVSQPVAVDLTPPALDVLSRQHVVRVGGAECAVYRAGPDAVLTVVEVGEARFPGTSGLFADTTLRAALFAVPQDAPGVRPAVVVADAAGNRRSAVLDVRVTPRRFAEKTLSITDEFLARKVPELLAANGLDAGGDLLAGYLRVNRDLRGATEARVREICRESADRPLWEGAFLRMPNAAPLSGFADRRTYVHDGKPIDHQTHLGFDLASLRGATVPAGNTGRVVFAGPLGIYGDTVILDHGLGLFSLYGHLSSIAVVPGAPVARGEPLGKTGETGLAAGDHLHFSVMIRGIHVDPTEWWDAHWIQDHVEARLAAFPRAGGAS